MQKSMIHSDHMVPLDTLEGFRIRPGFFDINGATALSDGVCFTIHSQGATSCELLLYEPYAKEPFTILKYPDNYRIGNVFSMIVFDLDVEDFQYAFQGSRFHFSEHPDSHLQGLLLQRPHCI